MQRGSSRRSAVCALPALLLAAAASEAAGQVRVLLVESAEAVQVAGLQLTPDLEGLRAADDGSGRSGAWTRTAGLTR